MLRLMLLTFGVLFLLTACSEDQKVRIISGIENGSVTVDSEVQGLIRVGYATVYIPSGDHKVSVELLSPNGEWLYKGVSEFAVKPGVTTIVELDTKKLATQKRKTRLEKEARAMSEAIPSIQMNMVVIPPGSFKMGSQHYGERPIHTVHIRSFKMSKYEVTQLQWQAVMGSNPSSFSGADNPVEMVSWDDAQSFLRKLNKQTGQKFRLPSEAEWEYSARAGSRSIYSWGNTLGRNRANCGNCGSHWSNISTAPVGSFEPNAFGLYDMHGNVWEYTQDCSQPDYDGSPYAGAPSNGQAWLSGVCDEHMVRGGSWNSPYYMKVSERDDVGPHFSSSGGGDSTRTGFACAQGKG